MTVLVLATLDDGQLDPAVASVVTAAAAFAAPIEVLLAGHNVATAAEDAARIAGVTRVRVADDAVLAHQPAEAVAQLVLSLTAGYTAVLAPANAKGRAVLPRVAAALMLPQFSDVIAIEAPDRFVRPVYSGTIVKTLTVSAPKKLLTIRASAFARAGVQPPAVIEPLAVPVLHAPVRFVSEGRSGNDLENARIVVAAGRGVGSREGFAAVEAFAARLGAAVGATRAAVDAGFAPNQCQIGQSGHSIAPDIYIGVGISGAIQHVAGIRGARCIAAINKDAEAPIFRIADIGLVGDLFAELPKLMTLLEQPAA